LNCRTSKAALGSNLLAILTCSVPKLLELSQTMHLLGNIASGFYQTWTFRAHVTTTPSNQGDISFMSVKDLMGIGTQEEIH